MDMEKSTQPQGLESLNKSLRTPQASSKTLQFDYEKEETMAEQYAKKPSFQNIVSKVSQKINS